MSAAAKFISANFYNTTFFTDLNIWKWPDGQYKFIFLKQPFLMCVCFSTLGSPANTANISGCVCGPFKTVHC